MKNRIYLFSSCIILILSLVACAAPAKNASVPAPAQEKLAVPTMAPAAAEEAPLARGGVGAALATDVLQQERKVIYNAQLSLVVTDTEATAQKIEELATSSGGYIANMNAYRGGSEQQLYYNITLRVPVSGFDSVRAALRDMAVRVEQDSINTDDVTDQYYDLDARLRTLRATEDELLALLKETRERGGKVEDIMSIYRELTDIQSQIESLQGQLNRLDKLTAFSTINVDLRPDELTLPVTTTWRPLQTLRDSFRTLIRVLEGLVDVLIYLIVVALPTLILLAIPVLLALYILRWLLRRLRKDKQVDKA